MRFYVSFGQAHVHRVNGMTFDADSLMMIEAENELQARIGLNQMFAGKWCGIYYDQQLGEYLRYFPNGVKNPRHPVEIVPEPRHENR